MSAVTACWLPPGRGLPLVAWSPSQLEAIAGPFGAARDAWARDWGVRLDGTTTASNAAQDEAAQAWALLAEGQGGSVHMREPQGWVRTLMAQLWGEPHSAAPIAQRVAGTCGNALREALAGAGPWSPAGMRSSASLPGRLRWSGSVLVTLPGDTRLLLDAIAARALVDSSGERALRSPARSTALVGVASAMQRQGMRVHVQLEGAQLDLGALDQLRVGDVLRLQHRLDTPARVHGADGTPLFDGHLVRARGRKAVELLPLA